MKNNILYRFAFNDLRVHKKDSMISIITIFIVAFIVMFISLMAPVLQLDQYLKSQEQYGSYDYYSRFETIDELKKSKLRLDNKDIPYNDPRLSNCIVYSSGHTLLDDKMNSIQGDKSILSINLKDGKMPVKESEVAVKKSVLDKWGYQEQLNTTVTFSYINKEVPYLKEFKLVGILKETGETDIVVSNIGYNGVILYVDKNNTDASIRNQDHNFITSQSYELVKEFNDTELSFLAVIIEFIVLAVSFALLSGLTLSSFEKKERDYTLLRSIGITKKQMYYIIFVQVFILSIIPILLSMGIVYIISLILPLIVNWPISINFSLGSMLWSSFNVFMVACISYFIPAKNACKRAISGSFSTQEFQYFYYRYKKLHKFNLFYLGWRQLVAMKKKMFVKIFFIFIIILCVMELIGPYTIYSQVNEIIKKDDINEQINLQCTSHEQDKTMNKEDFDFIKPYINQIDFYNYARSDELSQKGGGMYLPDLYCLNDALKSKYGIDNINDNQIVLSKYYVDSIEEININSNKFSFFNKEYDVVEIIGEEYDSIAIVNENTYKEYGDLDKYQKVEINFNSINEKTKAYTDSYQDIALLKEKYYIYDTFTNSLELDRTSKESGSSLNSVSVIIVSIAIAISFIYIYQFSFELLKQKEDIGTLQLLGLQKKEIKRVYLYKSITVAGIGIFLGLLYYYLGCYYTLKMIDLEYILYNPKTIILNVMISFIIVIIIVSISLIPLRSILKSDGLENKNTRE